MRVQQAGQLVGLCLTEFTTAQPLPFGVDAAKMKGGVTLLCLEYAALAYAASEGGRPRGVSPECEFQRSRRAIGSYADVKL